MKTQLLNGIVRGRYKGAATGRGCGEAAAVMQ
jgi:hypothetical protein